MNAFKRTGSSAAKTIRRAFILLILTFFACSAWAQTDYLSIDVDDLFGLWYSESDWGDYDNDNDLDLLMVGYGLVTGQGYNKFYRNDGNSVFTLLTTDMLGTGNGSTRFADLDGDNDLDALICGQVATNIDTLRVYINNAGTFTDCGFNFPPRVSSSVSYGDYDCDGDLDILVSGGTIDDVTGGYLHVFRNEGNFQFTPIEAMNPGIRSGNAEFGDYNGDGWLDIALTGSAGSNNYISKILRGSEAGTFVEIPAVLAGLRYSRISWVDYDADGDQDIILSGSFSNESPSVFKLYRNDGNEVFTDVAQPNVIGERQGDLVWGDINNDGFADILVNGLVTNTSFVEKLYLYNPQTGLYDDTRSITYLKYAAMTLGDYNNDNKLDMSISGLYSYQDYWNELYENIGSVANTPPLQPSALSVVPVPGEDGNVILFWEAASDAQTPAAGLTYNVRMGTTPGGNDIVSSMAVPNTGWRKVARPGNACQRLFYPLYGLPDDTYYWSVQAIDNSFAGSPFAPEQSFTIGVANQDDLNPACIGISNRPNPFQSHTEIALDLRMPGRVQAAIYNLKGQKVRILADGEFTAGRHQIAWDGTDGQGQALPSGIYVLRVHSGTQTQTHNMMHIK